MNAASHILSTSVMPAPRDAHGGRTNSERDKLTKQAQTWVGQTFFGTLLKQMRMRFSAN